MAKQLTEEQRGRVESAMPVADLAARRWLRNSGPWCRRLTYDECVSIALEQIVVAAIAWDRRETKETDNFQGYAWVCCARAISLAAQRIKKARSLNQVDEDGLGCDKRRSRVPPMFDDIEALMDRILTPMEKWAVEMRFGTRGMKAMPPWDISRALGMKRQDCEAMIAAAMEKLRKSMPVKG